MEDLQQTAVVVIASGASAGALTSRIQAAGHHATTAPSIDDLGEIRAGAARCLVIEAHGDAPTLLDTEGWARLRRRGEPAVIVYDGSDLRFVVRAMREGAVDVLAAPADGNALLAAVVQAMAKAERSHHDAERGARARQLLARCTPRERTIIAHVTQGLRNKTIASDLACKESTVKVHRSRAMRKLGLRSLAELLRLVESAGGAATLQASSVAAPPRAKPVTARRWAGAAMPAGNLCD